MQFHSYESRKELAEALATGIGAVLAGGIATRGQARLAVSGGSTPKLFFETLSKTDLDWERVRVTLVDERFVAPDSDRSNAGMVQRLLLQNNAKAARFIPLCDGSEESADKAAETADHAIAMLGQLDAAVLGMGTDGHTASFFPGGDRLTEALDLATPHHVIPMQAEGAGEPRLTMTLHYLLEARFLALHVEGAEKRTVLEDAMFEGPHEEMPVRALIDQAGERLHTFWAP